MTNGVVMMISASTSSWSNLEFSPSLSDVVTRVCPWSSSHLRMPSSFSVVPVQFASEKLDSRDIIMSSHPAVLGRLWHAAHL
jgi:hypothetical protein